MKYFFLLLTFTLIFQLIIIALNHLNVQKQFEVKEYFQPPLVKNSVPTIGQPLSKIPRTFQRYIKWHAEMRNCLALSTCVQYPKILLWRCKDGLGSLCWGTGDRLRGISSSLVLAMMTNRLFLLEWPDQPFPFLEAVIPSQIDWTVPDVLNYSTWPTSNDHKWPLFRWESCPLGYTCIGNTMNSSSLNNSKPMIHKHLNLSESETYGVLRTVPNFVLHSRSLNSFRNRLIARPEWTNVFEDFTMVHMSQFSVNRFLIKSLFQPSTRVLSILHDIIPDEARRQGYISIHVRTGEDVGEQSLQRFAGFQKDRNELGMRFLSCAFSSGLKKGGRIFLASDSWKLKSTIVNQALHNNISILFTEQSAKHVASFDVKHPSNKTKDIWNEKEESSEWKIFLNIFVEFFGLAGGKMMIGNRSEFSRLAFLIGDARKRRILNASCEVCKCA